MATEGSKRQTMMALLYYTVWAAIFWVVGAVLLLTGIIPSGAPVSLLFILACGALVHAASVYEFGSHLAGTERFAAFSRALTDSWRCAVWRGVVAGFVDIVLTAGMFMVYRYLPDVGGGWGIAIMICILLLPPYLVLLFVIYWFTRRTQRFEK